MHVFFFFTLSGWQVFLKCARIPPALSGWQWVARVRRTARGASCTSVRSNAAMPALPADATLILLMLCDPPHLADIRESLEVARAAGCARVAVAPLGAECAAPAASALARYVQCQLALAHCAPFSLALGAAAGGPALLAPSPATASDTTCVPSARRRRRLAGLAAAAARSPRPRALNSPHACLPLPCSRAAPRLCSTWRLRACRRAPLQRCAWAAAWQSG
jgi:hypothetical protein